MYKKHYPPALTDEVWRLEKIGKDGSFHRKLNKAGILTVEDFLRLVVRDSQTLRNVRMWDFLSILLCAWMYVCARIAHLTCTLMCVWRFLILSLNFADSR